jgi:uncharacterized coiled-coil protein SlyX
MSDTDRAAFAAWWEEHGLGDFGRQRDAWEAATQRQQERIAQLEADVAHKDAYAEQLGRTLAEADAECRTLKSQVQALAPDAARYHYLSRTMGDLCITIADENTGPVLKAAAADSHIDAAIAASRGEAGNANV